MDGEKHVWNTRDYNMGMFCYVYVVVFYIGQRLCAANRKGSKNAVENP